MFRRLGLIVGLILFFGVGQSGAQTAANPGQQEIPFAAQDLTSALGASSYYTMFVGTNGVPGITWQTVFSSAPSTITINLEGSLDCSTWSTIDSTTSTTGVVRSVYGVYRCIRVNNTAVTGGAGKTLTVYLIYAMGARSSIAGTSYISGTTFTGPVLLPDGSVNIPSIGFASDNDGSGTGIYRGGANVLTITANGNSVFGCNANTCTFGSTVTSFIPASDTTDLGTSAAAFKGLNLARSIQGSKAKTITDASATAFVRVAIPQAIGSNFVGGMVIWTLHCDDGTATNMGTRSGHTDFVCQNITGTETCAFDTAGTSNSAAIANGTYAMTLTSFTGINAGTDTIDLAVTADCTGVAGPTNMYIHYRLDMPETATLTPQ